MDLLFLTDISQVEWAMNWMAQRSIDANLVTGDITVAAELEWRGIPFIDEWAFLSEEDQVRTDAAAYDLAAHWWNEQLAETEYHGFALAQATQGDLFLPFACCLNAHTAYSRLLASMDVDHIYGFFLPPTAICRNVPSPGFHAAISLSQAVLRWLAENAGIPLIELKKPRALTKEGRQWYSRDLPDALPPITRGNKCATRVALMLGTGLPPSEQAALERRWAGEPNWRFIRFCSWEFKPGGTMDWQWSQMEVEGKLRRAWEAYEISLAAHSMPNSEILGNPYLRFQFARIWAEMQSAARLGESFSALLDVMRPSLVVLGHDTFTVERVFVRIAREQRVPTVAFLHPGFRATAGYQGVAGEADYFLAWGSEDVRGLTLYGETDPVHIYPVGSAQYYTRYHASAKKADESARRQAQDRARQDLSLPIGSPVILLLTANIYLGLDTMADPVIHRVTWRELSVLAARRTDLIFVIKPHPSYDHFEFYRHLCRLGPSNLILLETARLDVALAASDIAVLINYCTTAALEAMLEHLPVVFLRTAIYPAYQDDQLKAHGAVSVSSVSELEAALERLLQDADFRDEVLHDAEIALAAVLGEREQPAPMDRIMEAFDRLALPPETGHDSETLTMEQQVKVQVSEATQLLWDGKSSEFLEAWEHLVARLAKAPQPTALVERTLFGIAYVIGATAKNAIELRYLMHTCLAHFGRVQAKDAEFGIAHPPPDRLAHRLLFQAYLSAMIRHVNTWHWDMAKSVAWWALRELPELAIPSGVFWRFFARSVVGNNRLALLLVNVIGNYSGLAAFKLERTV